MPNCTAYSNEFSFQHNVNDDQYLIYTAGTHHLVSKQDLDPANNGLYCICYQVAFQAILYVMMRSKQCYFMMVADMTICIQISVCTEMSSVCDVTLL